MSSYLIRIHAWSPERFLECIEHTVLVNGSEIPRGSPLKFRTACAKFCFTFTTYVRLPGYISSGWVQR